jgi:hypothetical protein
MLLSARLKIGTLEGETGSEEDCNVNSLRHAYSTAVMMTDSGVPLLYICRVLARTWNAMRNEES